MWMRKTHTCTIPVPYRRSGQRSAAPSRRLSRPDGCAETAAEPGCHLSSPLWWWLGETFCCQNYCPQSDCSPKRRLSTSPTAAPGRTRPETRCARRAAAAAAAAVATPRIHHLRHVCCENCFFGRRRGWGGSRRIRWGSSRGKWRGWSWQRRRTASPAPSGVQSWTRLSIYYIPWVALLSLKTQRRKHAMSEACIVFISNFFFFTRAEPPPRSRRACATATSGAKLAPRASDSPTCPSVWLRSSLPLNTSEHQVGN